MMILVKGILGAHSGKSLQDCWGNTTLLCSCSNSSKHSKPQGCPPGNSFGNVCLQVRFWSSLCIYLSTHVGR